MRYRMKKVSLEGNDALAGEEPAIEYQEPANPFLDSIEAAPGVEVSPELIETDIAEDTVKVIDAVQSVDDVAIAVEGLEAIALQLQSLAAAGNSISAESLPLLNIAVDNASRKFTRFKNSATVESLENFKLDPVAATSVSLENITAKIKAGYEALIAFIKEMWEKFKAFIGNVVAGATQAEKTARSNLDALKTANKDRAATSEITIPGILNNPVLSTTAINSLAKVIGNTGIPNYRDVISILNRIKGGDEITLAEASEAMHKVYDAYGRMQEDVYLGNLSFSNDQFPPSIKLLEGEDRTAKALKLTQVKEFTEANIKLCLVITTLRKTTAERHNAVSQLTAMIAGISQKVQSGNVNHMQIVRHMIQMLVKLNSFETRILGRSVKVANAINKICGDSIKAHG